MLSNGWCEWSACAVPVTFHLNQWSRLGVICHHRPDVQTTSFSIFHSPFHVRPSHRLLQAVHHLVEELSISLRHWIDRIESLHFCTFAQSGPYRVAFYAGTKSLSRTPLPLHVHCPTIELRPHQSFGSLDEQHQTRLDIMMQPDTHSLDFGPVAAASRASARGQPEPRVARSVSGIRRLQSDGMSLPMSCFSPKPILFERFACRKKKTGCRLYTYTIIR